MGLHISAITYEKGFSHLVHMHKISIYIDNKIYILYRHYIMNFKDPSRNEPFKISI